MTSLLPEYLKRILKKSIFYRCFLNRVYLKNERAEIRKNFKIRGPLIEKYLPHKGIGAKLGVLKGNFSRILMEKSKCKELHLIDPWYFLGPHWHWAGDNTSTVDAVCNILQHYKQEINEKMIFVHVQDDLKVLQTFSDHYFDWVYIDSSHAYEHTVEELLLLKDKVKPDGIIGGDDWRPDPEHRHHGVYRAVNEFMKKYKYKLLYADENNLQWFIKKDTV